MSRLVITRTRNEDLGKPQIVSIDEGFRGVKTVKGLAGKTQSILFDKYNRHLMLTSQDVHTEVSGTATMNGKMRNAYINAIGNRVFEVRGLYISDLIPTNPMPY